MGCMYVSSVTDPCPHAQNFDAIKPYALSSLLCASILHTSRHIPRARVAQRTSTCATARATKIRGQVLSWDLCEEFFLAIAGWDIDFRDCDGVEPWLDDAPHRRERPRRVDDVELAHGLWVSVLTDARCLHHIVLHSVEGGDTDTLEIEDGA